MTIRYPTAYREVDALLRQVLQSVQDILGSHFVGMYLDGSLATGDFDEDSDVDFVVVTDDDISDDLFSALRAMHERLAKVDSRWAIQLEGSYVSRHALRRCDPAHALHPNIERGKDERLKMVQQDEALVIHRHILREQGLTLAGPDPRTLIDPVSPNELRQAMLKILHGWAAEILNDRAQIIKRGYQSYTVLSLCRILYTLYYGTIISKPDAARWAKDSLDERRASLIERAWVGRHHPGTEASPEDVNETLQFIRMVREAHLQSELSS